MRRFISLFIIFAIQIISTQAATNAEFYVRGHVINGDTNEHISHATIAVVGTTIGTISDESGHFFLNGLSTGDYTLRASVVGYTPVDHKITVKSDEELVDLTFHLHEDVMSLDQIVVSANRTEIKRRNSPSIVNIMPADLFANVGAPTLADGLNFQPGVRVEDNCQNCGFTQVRVNGLDGHYSQILIDSRPMFSALTGVYGLEQIPANMIERVEVIRGGGSAIYGSSAIGGTINVITKMPEYNSAEIGHTLNIIEKGSLDNITTANISFVTDNQRAGATIFGQVRNRGSYDANGDGFTEIAELESQTLGVRTFFKTSDYSKLAIGYDYSGEYRRGGDNLEYIAHDERVEIAEMIEHAINGANINFDLFSKDYSRKLNLYTTAQHTDRESYYAGGGDEDAYGKTLEWISSTGAQLTQKWGTNMTLPSELVVGTEYVYNDLQDWQLVDPDDATLQTIHNYSFYAQNEWRNDKFGILVGGRLDKHSLLDNPVFSPRVNLRYNPSESVNFRLSYSTGFRAPQIFDEDLHITMVGGEGHQIVNAPDLEKESSQSINASADLYKVFGKWSTNLLVEGFYTIIDDAFAIDYAGDLDKYEDLASSDSELWVRYNSSGSSTRGFSVEARATLPQVVSLQASMTYQKSTYEEEEEVFDGIFTESILRSPDLYGYVTANFDLTRKLKLALSGTYTGSMLVPHEPVDGDPLIETTQDFFDANVKFSYTVPIVQAGRLELSAGVLNIFNSYQSDFDSTADRDAGYIYGPMSPRRFTFGAKLMF